MADDSSATGPIPAQLLTSLFAAAVAVKGRLEETVQATGYWPSGRRLPEEFRELQRLLGEVGPIVPSLPSEIRVELEAIGAIVNHASCNIGFGDVCRDLYESDLTDHGNAGWRETIRLAKGPVVSWAPPARPLRAPRKATEATEQSASGANSNPTDSDRTPTSDGEDYRAAAPGRLSQQLKQPGTVAWLIRQLAQAEGFAELARHSGVRAVEPSNVEGWYNYHRRIQSQRAADRDRLYCAIRDADGVEELRAWFDAHAIPWTREGVRNQRGVVFAELGTPPVEVDRMTLPAFLTALREAKASAAQATAPPTPPEPPEERTDGDLIARLLAGPDDAELSDREMALVEAHLRGIPWSERQREQKEPGGSEKRAARKKLTLIRDFNRNLRSGEVEQIPVDPPRNGSEPAAPLPLADLKPSERKAWAAYKLAEANGLVAKTDQEVYDWLDEQEDDRFVGDLFGYTLPLFDTWSRYVRAAREAARVWKNTPRAGRDTGSSVVKQSDL